MTATSEPRWITVGKNRRAGYVWLAADGLWHVQCGHGHLTFGAETEAEQAVAQWPAKPPPRERKPKAKPLSDVLTASDAGFVVHDDAGRELGGAIPHNGGFDCFALGEAIGRFPTEGRARTAIKRAAWRLRRERTLAREQEKAEALEKLKENDQ